MSQQFIALVKAAPRSVNTKYGQKLVIECSGNQKALFTLWRDATDGKAQALRPGDRITCVASSKGKESWVDNIPAQPLSNGFEDSAPQVKHLIVLPDLEKIAEVEIPENAGGAFDRHIASLASKIADCYRAVQIELPEVSEETIQKMATSVFIQLAKDTF